MSLIQTLMFLTRGGISHELLLKSCKLEDLKETPLH